MAKAKRILIIADINYNPVKMPLNQMPKLAKGFIRLGNDARIISYGGLLNELSPFRSRLLSQFLYKKKTDEIIAKYAKNYKPDFIYIGFPRSMDAETIDRIKEVVPMAKMIGLDGDPWPTLQKDNRIEIAKKIDILTITNDGKFLQDYLDAGVKQCVFMPNMCDPDIDRRYEVGPEWKTDILWTGAAKHHADSSETLREEIVNKLAQRENCSIYGCIGYPKIGGQNYLYAISGAKIGVNVNAVNTIKLYHSDRLTHYLACGTFVLAKRVPDTDLLFKDGIHIKYFDSAEEFFELADWYLSHEPERKKIADAGMQHIHAEFNSTKIAGYILELIEKGNYRSPWKRSF